MSDAAASPPSGGPWYRRGLRFRCLGVECGDCCSGKHGTGHVWVDEAEIEALARHLGLAVDDFTRRHVRLVGRRLALVEKPNLDCIFYEAGRGCTVYEARPRQCRAYPFWPDLLKTPRAWEAEKACCPGIEAEGAEIVDRAAIRGLLRIRSRP